MLTKVEIMKKIYLLLSLMLLPLVASAERVEIDGIYYELYSESKTAIVTKSPFGEYTGSIEIPMLVSYDNIQYSVTSIGNRAFYDCSGLTSVTSLNPTPPRIYSNTFNLYTAVLNVPIGRKAAYKAANYWRDFTNIKEIDVAGVQGIQVDKDQNARVYDLNGRRLNAPTKGVRIINGRKVLMK